MAMSSLEMLKDNIMPNVTSYAQVLDILKQQRIIWFGLCFGVDIYDTYLHQYPSPDPIDVARRERGALYVYSLSNIRITHYKYSVLNMKDYLVGCAGWD